VSLSEKKIARPGEVNLFAEKVDEIVKKLPYLVVRSEDVARGAS
jgi:hypothetical protein